MPNPRVFEIELARSGFFAGQQSQFELVRDLPDVPVMSETLLLMELMVGGRSVDLRDVSQVLLSDLGATVQIMRLAGRESCFIEDLPTRIEDCISGLGLQACLDAISRRVITRSAGRSAIMDTWNHAKSVADAARSLADEFSVNPEDAYLVGLLHGIGSLPGTLGWWQTLPITGDPDAVGYRMAQAWSLPRSVAEYFSTQLSNSGYHHWKELVQRAHRQSDSAHADCTAYEPVPLQRSIGALAHAFSS